VRIHLNNKLRMSGIEKKRKKKDEEKKERKNAET
jgi:hypothetical protein